MHHFLKKVPKKHIINFLAKASFDTQPLLHHAEPSKVCVFIKLKSHFPFIQYESRVTFK